MIDTLETRVEQDSMGEMSIPKDALYGLQTARSMKYFNIGDRTIPLELIYSYALLKILRTNKCRIRNYTRRHSTSHSQSL